MGRSRPGHPVRGRDHLGSSLGRRYRRAPARHAYDFTIGSVHVYRGSPYAASNVAHMGRRPVARRDRGAVFRRGRAGDPERPVRCVRPSRLRQALPRAACDRRRSGRGAGAVRAAAPRPGRERHGARDQHERAPTGGRRRPIRPPVIVARFRRARRPGGHDRLRCAPRRHVRLGARRGLRVAVAAGFDDSPSGAATSAWRCRRHTPNAGAGRSL